MSKIKRVIDGKEYEFEVTADEALDSIDTDDKGFIQKVIAKLGGKPVEPQKTQPAASAVQNSNQQFDPQALADVFAKALEPINKSVSNLSEEVKGIKDNRENEEKTKLEKQRDEIIQKALTDGRIAHGEVKEWTEKFAKEYHSDTNVLKQILSARQVDEKVKAENTKSQENNSDSGSNEESPDGKTAGAKSFTREQLKDREFFAKNHKAIAEAEKNGNILD